MLVMVSIFLNLNLFSDLSGECSMYNQECAFFCFGWKVLYMPVGSTLSVVLFKCAVYWFFCVFYLLFKMGYWNLLLLLHCCQFLLSDLSILVLHTKVLWFWVYVCLQLLYLSVEFTLLSFCHDLFFGGGVSRGSFWCEVCFIWFKYNHSFLFIIICGKYLFLPLTFSLWIPSI